MIDMPIAGYHRYGIADTVLDAAEFPSAAGEFCGGGLLYQWHATALTDLAAHLSRVNQTLAVHGIPREQIRGLVQALAGRGIDRIVPIGQALDFGRYWDGYDLYAEFTRRVALVTDP